jgi:hypothetical protein
VSNAFLLIYSDSLGTRDQIKAVLNSMPEVIIWRTDLPHCFYIISDDDAGVLARGIRAGRGNKGRFLVSEVSANKQGWLPKESWYLMRYKTHKPKQ